MKAILYSSVFENEEINNFIVKNSSSKLKLGVIPSDTVINGRQKEYFYYSYQKLPFNEFMYFDVGYEYEQKLEKELFDCDAIFLEGGNTFKFLWLLRKRGFIKKLYEYAEKGGILMGNSAGALILTPSILPAIVADYDPVGDEDFDGVGVTDFLVKPHYDSYKKLTDIFQEMSDLYDMDMALLNERQAVVVDGNKRIYVNNPLILHPNNVEVEVK